MRRRRALVASVLVLPSAACVGAQVQVKAPSARHPISLTESVFDEGHELLGPADLVEVDRFERKRRVWTMVYRLAHLTPPEWDLSEEVNALVERSNGEAVTQLSVVGDGCLLDFLFPLNLLPFWPGCADIVVSGAVVRRREPGGQRPAAARRPATRPAAAEAAPGPAIRPAAVPAAAAAPQAGETAAQERRSRAARVPDVAAASETARQDATGAEPEGPGTTLVASAGLNGCTDTCGRAADSSLGLSAAWLVRMARNAAIGAALDVLWLDPEGTAEARLWGLRGEARYHPGGPGGAGPTWWLGGGLGFLRQTYETVGHEADYTALALNAGGGAAFRLQDRWSLGPSVRVHLPWWTKASCAVGHCEGDMEGFIWQIAVEGGHEP